MKFKTHTSIMDWHLIGSDWKNLHLHLFSKQFAIPPTWRNKLGTKDFLTPCLKFHPVMMTGQLISHKYNARSESKSTLEDNRQLLIYDFPKKYLDTT